MCLDVEFKTKKLPDEIIGYKVLKKFEGILIPPFICDREEKDQATEEYEVGETYVDKNPDPEMGYFIFQTKKTAKDYTRFFHGNYPIHKVKLSNIIKKGYCRTDDGKGITFVGRTITILEEVK